MDIKKSPTFFKSYSTIVKFNREMEFTKENLQKIQKLLNSNIENFDTSNTADKVCAFGAMFGFFKSMNLDAENKLKIFYESQKQQIEIKQRFNNVFVKNVDEDEGFNICVMFKELGYSNAGVYNGCLTSENDECCYYGVMNGVFSSYCLEQITITEEYKILSYAEFKTMFDKS